jgi:hypothetical protein
MEARTRIWEKPTRLGMLQRLFHHDAASGVVLMLASALALVLAKLARGWILQLAAERA